MTSLDTIYEYAGLKFAGSLWAVLSGVGLPLILALAGVAFTVHTVAERGSIRPLAIHLLYLMLAAGLLASTSAQGVPAPRFVVWLGQATDLLQKRAVKQINDSFLTAPFEYERIAARVSSARVLDPGLDRDIGLFLASCGRTTLARAEPSRPNLLRDGALPYEGACEDRRRGLWQRLQAHVQQHPQHRATIEAARAKDPAQGAAFADRYADELALRAIDEPGGSVSESALVRASLGEYSAMDPTQSTGAIPSWAKATLGVAGYFFGDEMANVALTGLAELHQDYVDRWTAKQRYYVIAAYGPHIYGILVMILLGLFPIAGLFALCPGQWKVFLNYSRFFLSLKFWPVGWSLLSSFNQRRGILEAFESPERVNGTPFLVIATMYLLVPGIAFAIVHLATTAAALPFAQAAPSAAGPGAGPVAPAVHVAARLAK